MQCPETRITRLFIDKDGKKVIQPILSMRNRLNSYGIKYKFGKKRGQLKPCKHKDVQAYYEATQRVSENK